MPPWNQMTPQQQQQLLQMMFSRGTAGMQMQNFAQMPGMMQQPGMAQMGANPLTGQAQNIMQNPMMMQYLMGMQGQQPGMQYQQPSLAQLLQMRGTGLGL